MAGGQKTVPKTPRKIVAVKGRLSFKPHRLARLFEKESSPVKAARLSKKMEAGAAIAQVEAQAAAILATRSGGQAGAVTGANAVALGAGAGAARPGGMDGPVGPAMLMPVAQPLGRPGEANPLPQRQLGAISKMTTATVHTIQPGGSQDIRAFLQTAATPKRSREQGNSPEMGAKRMMEDEAEAAGMEEGDMEAEGFFRRTGAEDMLSEDNLAGILAEHGTGGLAIYVRKIQLQTIQAVADKMRMQYQRIVRQEIAKEAELDKCRRSLVIQHPDKWMEGERDTVGFGMTDRVTAAIHKATFGMVAVSDAFTIGGNREGGPPPAVHITFASAGQKGCWYSVLAAMSRRGGKEAEKARFISCRDSFPKEHLGTVRQLNGRGMELKRNGDIGSYRIKAQGPACIPVLEVRDRVHRGPGGWRVRLENAREEDNMEVMNEANGTTRSQGQDAAGAWQKKAREAQQQIERLMKEQQHANEQHRRIEMAARATNERARAEAAARRAATGGQGMPMQGTTTQFVVGDGVVNTY